MLWKSSTTIQVTCLLFENILCVSSSTKKTLKTPQNIPHFIQSDSFFWWMFPGSSILLFLCLLEERIFAKYQVIPLSHHPQFQLSPLENQGFLNRRDRFFWKTVISLHSHWDWLMLSVTLWWCWNTGVKHLDHNWCPQQSGKTFTGTCT